MITGLQVLPLQGTYNYGHKGWRWSVLLYKGLLCLQYLQCLQCLFTMQEGQLQCGIITTADSWPGVRAAVLQCYVLILQWTQAKLRWLRRRVRRLNTNLELILNHDLVIFRVLELKIERKYLKFIKHDIIAWPYAYFNFYPLNWSLNTKCIDVIKLELALTSSLTSCT